ncbi:MAG: hypothetical protein SO114_03840 [Candidatus Cryptobacteroides sp.]|nr:hypothetical protein [Candidatus Cryptobacteroides sp.]
MKTDKLLCLLLLLSCNRIPEPVEDRDNAALPLDQVAQMLSELPMEPVHFKEVHRAVSSSSGNGYDEEYMMRDLFASPGRGVGEEDSGKSGNSVEEHSKSLSDILPLRDLIIQYAENRAATKASGFDPGLWLESLSSSDIQIYWPYSEDWDGETQPVFTYDPGDGSQVGVGWKVYTDERGVRTVRKIEVDEKYAAAYPVWVVNRNSDSGYTSLDVMRREHPEWDNGGGALIIGGPVSSRAPGVPLPEEGTKAASSVKTLILKDFTMKRHYDTWLAGGSEFFIKAGSVNDFVASTEAELQLYVPAVTDFMVVVKRKQLGQALPFNTVLVSDWTSQLTQVAFMIVEDDGGSLTQWKCSAVVKVASKSYGFDISLPFNTRDDIVWRGQLSRRYIEATDKIAGHFGDVDITFEVVDY